MLPCQSPKTRPKKFARQKFQVYEKRELVRRPPRIARLIAVGPQSATLLYIVDPCYEELGLEVARLGWWPGCLGWSSFRHPGFHPRHQLSILKIRMESFEIKNAQQTLKT